ncbi:MAG: copper resistance protein NlpE [Muribaculaceae bacterium]|nr:copper resistance protein NlpE [Muribaculaceae bacterium]
MKKTMRMIGMTLVAIILSLSFTACGDDEADEPETHDSSLIGTWECVENETNFTEVTTVTFKSNGTYTCKIVWTGDDAGVINHSGTWTASNNILTITFEKTDDPEEFTIGAVERIPYYIKGKVLYIDDIQYTKK